MLSSRLSLSSLLAAAALGTSAFGGHQVTIQAGPNLTGSKVISTKVKGDRIASVKSPEQRAAFRNSRSGASYHGRWPGRGSSVAHDRRMAR